MAREREAEVVILGGGPAGSTAGALLAEAGIETLIVEGERFPRFHVGESLLPHTLPLLDRLGVHETVRALPHTRMKEGASFVTHDGGRHVAYWFADAMAPAIPHAYQVRRDEFDAALLARARELGAEVLEGWHATSPQWDGTRLVGLAVEDADGSERVLRAKAYLDASGQQSFLAGRMGWRFPYPKHHKVAAVSHFRGAWLPGGREAGNITIVLTDGGWFWLIPFADDTVSVGAVLDVRQWRTEGGRPVDVFHAAVERTAEVARRLAGAEPVLPFAAIQNFSYRVMKTAGDPFCLIGDAAGFLDPIFSTGVFIATATGAAAAEDVIDALRRHGRVEANDFAPTVALTRTLQRVFFSFIRAFYDPHFLPFFFNPRPALNLPAAIVSLLAADVLGPGRWRRTGRFRLLLGLAQLQRWAAPWGRSLVEPLDATPAGAAP
jgi:flavin-dependent dehydrogenase